MSRPETNPKKPESSRAWLAGVAITLTILISLFGFWHLSPGPTFIISVLALFGVVISFWFAGRDA